MLEENKTLICMFPNNKSSFKTFAFIKCSTKFMYVYSSVRSTYSNHFYSKYFIKLICIDVLGIRMYGVNNTAVRFKFVLCNTNHTL